MRFFYSEKIAKLYENDFRIKVSQKTFNNGEEVVSSMQKKISQQSCITCAVTLHKELYI